MDHGALLIGHRRDIGTGPRFKEHQHAGEHFRGQIAGHGFNNGTSAGQRFSRRHRRREYFGVSGQTNVHIR